LTKKTKELHMMQGEVTELWLYIGLPLTSKQLWIQML